ncbi:hypothetical protein L9F63_007532, partial [Diploptera punctata]
VTTYFIILYHIFLIPQRNLIINFKMLELDVNRFACCKVFPIILNALSSLVGNNVFRNKVLIAIPVDSIPLNSLVDSIKFLFSA